MKKPAKDKVSAPSLSGNHIPEFMVKAIKNDLRHYYSAETLRSRDAHWTATLIDADWGELKKNNAPAYLHFEYFSPHPENVANPEIILDYLQPAIWAHCIWCEFSRNGSALLAKAFFELESLWHARKKSKELADSLKGSEISHSRERKIDPARGKSLIINGYTRKQIASEFGVSYEAARKFFIQHKDLAPPKSN